VQKSALAATISAMSIPTEPIGSIPRPPSLIEAVSAAGDGTDLENARSILVSRQRAERELIATQEALVQTNERLQLALEAGHLGTWNWDAANDRLTLGPRAAEIVGLPADTPFSRAQIREHLPAEDAQRAREALDRALAERTDYGVEYRVNRSDGSQCWIAASGRGRYADDGTVLGMTGVMQDITAKKREEQVLREADARKDEFLATLAHELRNPLAPLRTSLEILRQEGISQETRESARMVMLRQVNQMVALIDDLIDISRISTGRIELNREHVALAAVVESALEISRPLIDAHRHYLSLELPANATYLDADKTRVAQILSNLLNNAAKYSEPNGRIRLSAAVEGGQVAFTVADTGIGIAPEMLSRVFEMFVQVDKRLERTEGGLGVGLTLARRLAELHGGTLEARSSGLGHGSEFILRLKIAAATPASTQPSVPAAKNLESRRRRVLVVDDNVDHADSLTSLLRMDGHEVHTAYDGLAAIDAVSAWRPEVVLLDIGMPGLNGYETARRIRERDRDGEITLIALSGWGQPRDRRLAAESGFDHHLVKPVEPAVLQRMIMEERRSPRVPSGHPLRVLLVDDNLDLRASLASILQGAGCDTRTAPNGAEALEVAKNWRPAVVFVDIHMPGLNGFQVANRLREQFSLKAMKLVLMSGVSIDETLTRDAKQAGFDACIDKMATPDCWLRQLDLAAAE
jgi:PAS domain S-box-containing protein